MTFPGDNTILALHRKYAPTETAFHIVYTHCQIIEKIAKQLIAINGLRLNERLVHAAALLHDIGYYPLLNESGWIAKGVGIKHGTTGADVLRKEGVNEALCRIAERHTGVGLTKENIIKQNLPLPQRDLVPESPEEWLITYADKLHSKAISIDESHDILGWFNSPETYFEHARKFGEDNAATFAHLVEKYGKPDLQALAIEYGQELR